jgi:hypothetical protein
LAPQLLSKLQRMKPAAIANEFKAYCAQERSELLPTLPKRLRSMEPQIERIIARRVAAGATPNRAKQGPPTASKRP